jgi:hypothetical protein
MIFSVSHRGDFAVVLLGGFIMQTAPTPTPTPTPADATLDLVVGELEKDIPVRTEAVAGSCVRVYCSPR